MLDFSQEFFLEETREGFTIDSTMKSYWAACLEVLREVAEICERHDLQWYAAFGTLLGTIRHEGFVPWDDDMDIWMKREDYNKFLQIAPYELPKGFDLKSCQTDVGYNQFHSCLFNATSISVSEERLRNYHGCPFAAGIDIFPLDILPRDPEERQTEHDLYFLIGTTVGLVNQEEWKDGDMETLNESFDMLEEIFGVTFDRALLEEERLEKERNKVVSFLFNLANQLTGSYTEEEGDEWVMYMDYVHWPFKVYKKEWFEGAELMPFEEFGLMVPVGYDEILKLIYGDYWIRARGGTMHEYPIYGKQLKYMREVTEGLEAKAARIEELIELAKKERIEREIQIKEEDLK